MFASQIKVFEQNEASNLSVISELNLDGIWIQPGQTGLTSNAPLQISPNTSVLDVSNIKDS